MDPTRIARVLIPGHANGTPGLIAARGLLWLTRRASVGGGTGLAAQVAGSEKRLETTTGASRLHWNQWSDGVAYLSIRKGHTPGVIMGSCARHGVAVGFSRVCFAQGGPVAWSKATTGIRPARRRGFMHDYLAMSNRQP